MTTLQELENFIENKEYNYMNSELMEFAISIKNKIEELKSKELKMTNNEELD